MAAIGARSDFQRALKFVTKNRKGNRGCGEGTRNYLARWRFEKEKESDVRGGLPGQARMVGDLHNNAPTPGRENQIKRARSHVEAGKAHGRCSSTST